MALKQWVDVVPFAVPWLLEVAPKPQEHPKAETLVLSILNFLNPNTPTNPKTLNPKPLKPKAQNKRKTETTRALASQAKASRASRLYQRGGPQQVLASQGSFGLFYLTPGFVKDHATLNSKP